jgi:hypothetical protein
MSCGVLGIEGASSEQYAADRQSYLKMQPSPSNRDVVNTIREETS